MTQNNNNLVARNNDPEQIDLLDLALQLWRGKWVIGAFIAAFIVLAAVYLTAVKEKCVEYPLWWCSTFNA